MKTSLAMKMMIMKVDLMLKGTVTLVMMMMMMKKS